MQPHHGIDKKLLSNMDENKLSLEPYGAIYKIYNNTQVLTNLLCLLLLIGLDL